MRRTIYPCLAGFVIVLLIFSCERDNQIMTGKIINDSGCKNSKSGEFKTDTPDSLACVFYSYDKSESKLSVNHINAGFNCCPEKLFCNISLKGDTIIISESEKKTLCRCDCLYDLDIEITGVDAKEYNIKFIEPYAGNQEKIIFHLDLKNTTEGSFCVLRNQYPWGTGP